MRGLRAKALDMAGSGASKPIFAWSRAIAIPHPGPLADCSSRDCWDVQRVGPVPLWLFPTKANGR